MLRFKLAFSLSSFTFIKMFFSSSLLSAIRVVSLAYLRLLIFSPAILTLTSSSSILAFLMMFSAFKLNKQGDSVHPCHTPFLIWNQSIVPCLVLSVASSPAHRFLRKQVSWFGVPISWRIFHSLLWSTQSKVFGIFDKVEVDIFFSGALLLYLWSNRCWQFDLWFPCLF